MTGAERVKEIQAALQTTIRGIKKIDGYVLDMPAQNVIIGFVSATDNKLYPSCYLAYARMSDAHFVDQITKEAEVRIEMYCYIKKTTNVLFSVEDLLSDIEEAIDVDPELDKLVRNVRLQWEAAPYERLGIGLMILTAFTNYAK